MTAILHGGAAPQPDPPSSFLDELKTLPIWLLWRSVPNRDPSKKPDKVPYYVCGSRRHGALDTPEDRARLVTYAEAVAAYNSAVAGRYAGLALALGPDGRGGCVQGIDLDGILDAGLTDIADLWTRGSCAGLGYVEASPSGTGLHLLGYGRLFRTLGSNKSGIEAYAGGRFFTFTGRVIVEDSPCRKYDLADYIETVLAPRHQRASAAAPAGANALSVPDSTKRDLRSALQAIPCDEYHLWVRMGLALAELGTNGRALWLEWSALSEKYDPAQAGRKWETFRPGDTGHQAVFAEATRQGWVNPRDAERISHGAEVAASIMQDAGTPGAAALALVAVAGSSNVAVAGVANSSRRLQLLVDSDLHALPPLRWLVKGIVPDAGIGAIYGASGTFKSFLTLDLLAHVSNGREWFGHRVKGAPAVYVPFEGQGGIPKRIRAWRLAQTIANHPDRLATYEPDADVLSKIAVVLEPLSLRERADRDRLVATLKEQGWAGGILCVDTLAHASAGIEENSSAMGEMIGIFRDLQQQLGGVILLVHHSGKDEARGMRGWSGLHAAMDFVIECQQKGEPNAREAAFSLAKVKDGATGTVFGFRMQQLPLGFDDDGDAETSLYVCPNVPSEQADHPFVVVDAVAEAAADDAFVDAWVRRLMTEGKKPTGRNLDGQLPLMKPQRELTQKRLRDAIARLKGDGRLEDTPGGPGGAKWLRAVDTPQVAA